MACAGSCARAHGRMMQGDLPAWWVVYQQTQRWVAAGVFEAMVNDLRMRLRLVAEREAPPSAVIFDSRTVQSTPDSGAEAGYEGVKKRRGRKVHLAVDTLGQLLVAYVTAANEQDRAQVAELSEPVQAATGGTVEVAFVDQGYTGDPAARDAASQAIRLAVVKLSEAKRSFIRLPKRWLIERSMAWVARFRRLTRAYERLPHTLTGLHFLAFACLLLGRFAVKLGFST